MAQAGGLGIFHEDGSTEIVPFAELQYQPSGAAGDRVARPAQAGWRLHFPGGLPPALVGKLPAQPRYGQWVDGIGLARAALVCGAISAAIIGIVLTAPQWLGPLVPLAVETRIGDALVGDFAKATCHTPAGDAALARLIGQVDLPKDQVADQAPVQAQVIKFDMVNAVALPGNRVILFSGLFDELKEPDAVAGVIAHELGHARRRHVMQALLREFGLSVVLAGTTGTVPGQVAQISGLRYSRQAEAEADRFAQDRLAAASISPLPTASFFAKAAKEELEGPWLSLIASHPASAQRAQAFRASARPGATFRPALSPAEWQALARMCDDDKRAKPLIDL